MLEQERLRLLRPDHISDPQFPPGADGRGKDYVRAIGPAEFLEQGARAVPHSGPALPLLQGLPQHVGQEANQDAGLYRGLRSVGFGPLA